MSLNVKFSATDVNFADTVSKIKREIEDMDDEVKKTRNGVESSFGSMVKAGAGLALGFGAIKSAIGAITGTLDTFKEALDLGGTMKDLSERTGETAGNLLILSRAFENSGVGADKVGTSINKLQKFMDNAAQGGEKQNEVLGRLGLTMADMAGKTPTQQMALLAEKLNGVNDDGTKASLAMDIFGKSGGLLLPLMENFSDELETAKNQLGSMPKVFDLNSEAFDNISDNIKVAKGKLVEFAAGLLESLAPALELATDLITRFDAAGAGMKLGEIITGASNAMGGFTDALSAIKLGEFGLAFKMAFASIQLQAADSINSIVANVMAAAQASGTFLLTAFGPGSGIFTIIGAQFDILAAQFSTSMLKAMSLATDQIPGMEGVFSDAIESNARTITNSQNKISNAIQQIGGDFKRAGQEMSKAYDAALGSSKQLINTSAMEAKLQEHRVQLKKLEATAAAESAKSAAHKLNLDELNLKVGKQRVSNEERIKELDADIASAKRQGNNEELGELKAMKAYYEELESSQKRGLSLEQSITNAVKARQNVIDGIGKLTKKEANQTDEIKKNMIQIKTVGELIAKTKAAEPMKSFKQQAIDARKQVKELANFLGGDFSRLNIMDLAKKLGIETTRKGSRELFVEIQKKLDEISNKKVDIQFDEKSTKEQLIEIQKKVAAMKTGSVVTLDASSSISEIRSEMKKEIDLSLNSSAGSSFLETISSAVEKIQQLVAKIEPKLPTAALGV